MRRDRLRPLLGSLALLAMLLLAALIGWWRQPAPNITIGVLHSLTGTK